IIPKIKAIGSIPNVVIGYLNRDGTVTNNGTQLLQVTSKSVVVDMGNPPTPIMTSTLYGANPMYSGWSFVVQSTDQLTGVGYIDPTTSVLYPASAPNGRKSQPVQWGEPQDSCNLTKVRLVHLDGTAVTDTEYDG